MLLGENVKDVVEYVSMNLVVVLIDKVRVLLVNCVLGDVVVL